MESSYCRLYLYLQVEAIWIDAQNRDVLQQSFLDEAALDV